MGKDNDVLHVKSCGLKLPISKRQPSSVSPILSVILQESIKVPPFSEMKLVVPQFGSWWFLSLDDKKPRDYWITC